MTTIRLLASERAESAQKRLMLVYASYQGWRTADALSRPRLSRLRTRDPWIPISAPAVISQLVATAEFFSAGLLMDNAEEALEDGPSIAHELWRRQRNRVESTWADQMNGWTTFFGVDFKSANYFEDLKPFIEARNSVMHGLDGLTRRQQRDRNNIIKTLNAGGMGVVGNTLNIPHRAVTVCRDVTRNFILWLDLEDQRRAFGA